MQWLFSFAEMQGRTLSEVLGLKRHKDYISDHELSWWLIKSLFEPMPNQRQNIFQSNISLSGFNSKNTYHDWYDRLFDFEESVILEKAMKENREIQAELDRKNGKNN